MGGVAEWTMATVLKTVNPQGFVGSNPTPSAMFVVPETPAESAAATGDYDGALRALTDAGFKTVTDDSLIVHHVHRTVYPGNSTIDAQVGRLPNG